MQDLAGELRAVRKVLWVLVALWFAQILLDHRTALAPGMAAADEPQSTLDVNIVKIAGHTIVGRKLPVDTQE